VGEEIGAHSRVIGRAAERQERVAERWGAAALHGRHGGHIVEHVVCIEVDRAGVGLGWLQAELATGPKTKFEAHTMHYVFH
jgi:hypothetical protein